MSAAFKEAYLRNGNVVNADGRFHLICHISKIERKLETFDRERGGAEALKGPEETSTIVSTPRLKFGDMVDGPGMTARLALPRPQT